jgi:hypothetical protein
LQAFLERAARGHRFPTLFICVVSVGSACEGEGRNLGDDVINGRLEACGGSRVMSLFSSSRAGASARQQNPSGPSESGKKSLAPALDGGVTSSAMDPTQKQFFLDRAPSKKQFPVSISPAPGPTDG